MAKREVGEINAGSMADIAFLLLIFFLVTTTMEVDAGIGRNLPLKRDNQDTPEIEIRKRDVFEIMVNSNDALLVEQAPLGIDDLEEEVRSFYLANITTETDPDLPEYTTVTKAVCLQKMAEFEAVLAKNPENVAAKSELDDWKLKLKICEAMPGNSFREIGKMSIIQLKNQANTSFGRYIEIQDVLKKVVNDLRTEWAEKLEFDKPYLELRDDKEDDIEKIKMLRILVPERIIEAKIEK
jgi:biopolymer transport protein ExbD